MFKILMVTLIILFNLAIANENEETIQLDQVDKCEQIYDDCSLKCEKNEETNNEECFAKCEALFDSCQNETKSLENSNN